VGLVWRGRFKDRSAASRAGNDAQRASSEDAGARLSPGAASAAGVAVAACLPDRRSKKRWNARRTVTFAGVSRARNRFTTSARSGLRTNPHAVETRPAQSAEN
jgi:hypothetical protein